MEMKTVKCQCGRNEHYADANYCVDCGKRLEEEKATK